MHGVPTFLPKILWRWNVTWLERIFRVVLQQQRKEMASRHKLALPPGPGRQIQQIVCTPMRFS